VGPMDARTKKQDTHPAFPRMRIAALAVALATLPVVGAGIHAQEVPATRAVPQAAPEPAPFAAPPEPVAAAPAVVEAPPAPAPVEFEPAPIATMEPGEFLWYPEVAPHGDVAIVVSLPEQRLHVYRNALRIGVS